MSKPNKYPANKLSKEQAQEKLSKESFKRVTLSFYRYINISNPAETRNQMYLDLEAMGVLGRIYLAAEGINGQISVPEPNWGHFKNWVENNSILQGIRLNLAIEQETSFLILIIKVKKQIVADNLPTGSYDLNVVGKHLNAEEFNKEVSNEEAILIDMRNHYESEVGRFDNAICPDADTFREELDMVTKMLNGDKEKKILMYCTGGIRCEKASAYLIHQGYKDVNQLEGGIINYTNQIKKLGIPSKFKGKNFVFDERLGERITEDVLSKCHICDAPCDHHNNCANDHCHILFIQCDDCAQKLDKCCSPECQKILALPIDIKKGMTEEELNNKGFSKRLRPNLKKDTKK